MRLIRHRYSRPAILALLLVVIFSPAVVRAEPSQEAVFKSISSNVDSTIDGRKLLAGILAIGAVVALMVVLSQRQNRKALPQNLNSNAKLLRELVKTAGLKPSEARQLKALAERLAKAGRPVDNPVTLLLAPSIARGDSRADAA